jgi:hypothetical protein
MAKSKTEAPKTDKAEKVTKETPITEAPKLSLAGDQQIVGICGGLVKDKVYHVSADVAMVLIAKGFATLQNT